MARILAIESSAELCSVALFDRGEVVERSERAPRQHAQRLLPLVDELLKPRALSVHELDAIAFGCGPGSFTGLRIAAGFAQGMALGAGLPVVPVSNLRALAFSAARSGGEGYYLPLIDARMEEVYWAAYQVSGEVGPGALVALCEEQVCPPEHLLLPDPAQQMWYAAGSGLVYKNRFTAELLQRVQQENQAVSVEAGVIAQLAADDFAQGRQVPAEQGQPSYIRNEVAWKKLPGRD